MAKSIYEAASKGSVSSVKRLIKDGYDVNEKDRNTGYTPLMIAARRGYLRVIYELLGADDIDVNGRGGDDFSTALLVATKYKRWKTARVLVARGDADVSIPNEDRYTPMWWAARYGRSSVLNQLLNAGGADPDNVNYQNYLGSAALHVAARYGREDCALLLLSRGADKTLMDLGAETPVDKAKLRRYHKLAKKIERFELPDTEEEEEDSE